MGFEKTSQRCASAAFLLMLACTPESGGVCPLTTAGTVFNDGSSWAVRVILQQALSASSRGRR